MNRTKKTILILSAFMLMAFTAAQADVIVLQTAPVGGNIVDWSTTGLPVGFQAHGFVGVTTLGDTGTATVSGGAANKGTLMQQGTTWFGNFANNEYLIWSSNSSKYPNGYGPITLTMGLSYSSLGAYIQQDFFGPFTAQIEVFHLGTLLATLTEAGVSNGTPGTAIFIGALDKTGPNITKLVFSETAGNHITNFAIGTVYAGVPEPGTMVLLGTGLLGLAGVARRRMTK